MKELFSNKLFIVLLKTAFVLSALSYVFYNTDLDLIKQYSKQADLKYLLYAFMFLTALIIVSGLRLRIYLSSINVKAGRTFSIILIYIGMFFNLFLPGGIGGDAYLAYYTKKKYDAKLIDAIRVMLTSRANGLFFLNIMFFVLFLFSDFANFVPHAEYIVAAMFVLQVIVYYLVSKYFLKEKLSIFFKAGFYSLLLQVFGLVAAMFVFFALGLQNDFINFVCLYIAAAILAVLPISPGGIGIRELVFFEGAKLLSLDAEFAVAASLLFFVIYLVASSVGLVFYMRLDRLAKKYTE